MRFAIHFYATRLDAVDLGVLHRVQVRRFSSRDCVFEQYSHASSDEKDGKAALGDLWPESSSSVAWAMTLAGIRSYMNPIFLLGLLFASENGK